ncbi:hypothetical protein ACWDR9_23675 [Streptosporangium sandarakinum]
MTTAFAADCRLFGRHQRDGVRGQIADRLRTLADAPNVIHATVNYMVASFIS